VTIDSHQERAEAIRERYREVFSTVPAGIEARISVAEATGRLQAVETIEELRRALLADNPLDARIQQLVHFAQLVALGREGPARLHAGGALRAGAELADLVGVAETSLVTSGMPAYALAIEIIADLIESSETSQNTPAHEAMGGMWDRRFSEKPWPSDPDALLVELAASLPPGRGIDLGSGPGRNSLWLAAKGWDMTLLDASRVALAQAEERAKEAGVHIETVHEDVLGWRPAGPTYDLVIVANLHPGVEALGKVLAAAADALVAGGHLFVVGHDITSLGHHGPPDPDRLLSVERLSRALPRSVSVETLGLRARGADHAPAPDLPAADANRPDVAVLAWATKRAA
jgi:4-carboxymuconolactone decarboxylase